MSTDLAIHESILPSAQEWKRMSELAGTIATTEFVPKELRGRPEAVIACILAGREIGIGPMRSLEHISIIDGAPNFSAELMISKIREAGHSVRVTEHTDTRVTVVGRRSDNADEHTVTWTIEDARRAKLAGKSNWTSYPRAMLTWRAVTDLVRFLFPDALGGLLRYTDDEIGGDGDPARILIDAETGEIVENVGAGQIVTEEPTGATIAADPNGRTLTSFPDGTVDVSAASEEPIEDAEFTIVETELATVYTDSAHVHLLRVALEKARADGLIGWTNAMVLETAQGKWGVESLDDLTEEQVEVILGGLEKAQAKAKEGAQA